MKSPDRGNVKSLSGKRATPLTVTDMPIYDDDDELRKPYESHAPWDTDRESAEIRDIVPDDLVTVQCTECGGSGQVRRVRQSILGQMVTASANIKTEHPWSTV